MVTHVRREVVLPGVGVYDPRCRRLEGDAIRVRGLNIRQSVRLLTVNVHDPLDLMESLASPRMAELRECSVNYRKDYSFGSLKRALETAAFDPGNLRLFKVTGAFTIEPWQVHTLRALFRCVSRAKLDIFGQIDHTLTKLAQDDVVEVSEGEWCRHYGNAVSLFAINIPWCEPIIRERKPTKLVIDCDNQFHLPYLVGGVLTDGSLPVDSLTLHNVTTTSQYLLEFLRKLNVPGLKTLELSSSDPLMQNQWIKAAIMQVKSRGFSLYFNGARRV